MARYYNGFSVDLVCQDLAEIVNKKSTPAHTAGVASMALEVIAQLRREQARRGEWQRDDDTGEQLVRCSVCREVYEVEGAIEAVTLFYHYCPNCGAKMHGGATMPDITKGQYANYDAWPKEPERWHFCPKRPGTKVGYAEVMEQLWECGFGGSLYVQLFRVPQDFPADADNDVILLEPEDACKMLAGWCGYVLYDQDGHLIK